VTHRQPSVFPVARKGTVAEADMMMVSGPGQKRRAKNLEARRWFPHQFLHHEPVAHEQRQRAMVLRPLA